MGTVRLPEAKSMNGWLFFRGNLHRTSPETIGSVPLKIGFSGFNVRDQSIESMMSSSWNHQVNRCWAKTGECMANHMANHM